MGFDNECILNIQSLAGEYFCPVCRLLVYPSEALQSQCTHLYCKPCLAYVATTTRACPYDGYLVTQADSKPLIESNKALAETIGKINVHCLYHRSGCSWQGPLSECTSHCSGCAFGNSPVVCNRCGVQIVHRQVQEHAQSCSGVQPQAHAGGAQDAKATSTTVASEQNQAVSEAGTATAQAQPPQTSTSSVPGVESSQQANSTTQSHSTVQTALPTAEQWYQQQQQYQQYYQQYPGYDPYQQHYQQYYPYQQQAVPQQSQALMQPQQQVPSQSQPQPHPQIQLPVVAQPQTNPQVNPQQQTLSTTQPQSQIQLQTHPPSHGQPPLQVQPHQQTNLVQHHPQQIQMPQYQQLHSQMQQPQPQVPTQAQSQLYPQHPAQGLSQTHAQHPMQPIQQPFASQPSQPMNPHLQAQPSSAHAVTGHQSYPQLQSQHQAQLGGPQHPLPYPQGGPHPHFPQQSPLLRASLSHTPIQNPHQSGFPPSQGQVLNVPSHQQPVHSHSHPPGMPVPQRPAMPSVQQPIHQQYLQQQQQQSFTGQGAYIMQHLHGHSQSRPQAPSHVHQQPLQNIGSPQGIQPHQYQAQTFAARPNVPTYGFPAYPHSSTGMQARPTLVGAEQQSGNSFRTSNQPQLSSEQHLSAKATSERQGDQMVERISEADTSSQKNFRDLDAAIGVGADAGDVKAVKSESDLKDIDNDSSKSTYEGKNVSQSFGGENVLKNVKEEPKEGVDNHKDVSKTNHDSEDKGLKDGSLVNNLHGKMQGDSVLMVDQGKQLPPLVPHQPKPIGSSLPEPTPGSLHHMQLPGHPSVPVRPLGASNMPPGPEIPPASVAGLGSTPVMVRGSQYGPQVPYTQGHGLPPYGEQTPYNYTDGRRLDPLGQQSSMHPSAMRMNGAPGMDSSMALGLRDDRSKPFVDDRAGLYPHDPSRWIGERKEFEDLKHFPRPSDLDSESVRKFGDNFPRSRPLDRGPLDKGFPVLNYDPGMKLEPPGVPAPSRFFRPYHHDGFYDNTVGRPSDFARAHPEISGPLRRYDRRHAPRSPGIDYHGVSPHRFGSIHGPDDTDGRESYRFGDSFHGTRFPVLPSHLHMGEFDGPGQDGFPNHFGRGGRLGEPVGFGAFRGPAGMGDLSGRGNFFRPRPGEPGFRSSFSVKGFPGDGLNYTDELDHFDNSRRKSYSMGWCRICRVDCETVEGLDLHSQTREHQKKAMDMVLTIKQNAKKQKLATTDHSSLDDASKPRNANIDSHGNKN